MSWVLVALLSYLLLAIANIGDKFLVDTVIKNSKAYALVVCVLGMLVFLVAPWFLSWPGFYLFIYNVFNGVVFGLAIWLLFESLKRGEASRVLVLIGGATPIFSLILSILILKESFTPLQLIGIFLIFLGLLAIVFLPKKSSLIAKILKWLRLSDNNIGLSLYTSLASAFLYALYFVLTKIAYDYQSFISAFIWTRLGALLLVLLFLFNPLVLKEIRNLFRRPKKDKSNILVILNQIIGSLGFILQNYAVFLAASVVLVNSFQGIQYAFILIFSAILSIFAPKIIKEEFTKRIVLQKSLSVLLIAIGIFLITYLNY